MTTLKVIFPDNTEYVFTSKKKVIPTYGVIYQLDMEELKKNYDASIKKLNGFLINGNWTKEEVEQSIAYNKKRYESETKNPDKWYLSSQHKNKELAIKKIEADEYTAVKNVTIVNLEKFTGE